MGILDFVDSRDIRGHLRSIGYKPSTVEAAYLVWFSKNAPLEQKCEAWREIARTIPNRAMKATIAGFGGPAIPDFHAFLRLAVNSTCAAIWAPIRSRRLSIPQGRSTKRSAT